MNEGLAQHLIKAYRVDKEATEDTIDIDHVNIFAHHVEPVNLVSLQWLLLRWLQNDTWDV